MMSSKDAPAFELAVLVAMRRLTARDLARRSGLAYPRTVRILRGEGHPSDAELKSLRNAIFSESST